MKRVLGFGLVLVIGGLLGQVLPAKALSTADQYKECKLLRLAFGEEDKAVPKSLRAEPTKVPEGWTPIGSGDVNVVICR